MVKKVYFNNKIFNMHMWDYTSNVTINIALAFTECVPWYDILIGMEEVIDSPAMLWNYPICVCCSLPSSWGIHQPLTQCIVQATVHICLRRKIFLICFNKTRPDSHGYQDLLRVLYYSLNQIKPRQFCDLSQTEALIRSRKGSELSNARLETGSWSAQLGLYIYKTRFDWKI